VGFALDRLPLAEVPARLTTLLTEQQARQAIVGCEAQLKEAIGLNELLSQASVTELDWRDDPDRAFDADLGLVDAHAGLAETGTLVCNSDAAHGRSVSLLPPCVFVLLRASAIVPDMMDYWRQQRPDATMAGDQLPASQVFITGPSKTADIEGELVTGVHGPGQVHVLVIEDG
jgi:L-lactate dehydrogenase complex protein LldG